MENMTEYKLLVINPGSTSTKLALFEEDNMMFETSVNHDAAVLNSFKSVYDQFEYRMNVINEFTKYNSGRY